MTHEETVWLAGWLEGEGCFLNANGSISISICSIDLDVITKVAALMGCTEKLRIKKPTTLTRHTAYVCRLGGQKAEDIMLAIRPYMGLRRGQKIDELIAWRAAGPARKSAIVKARWANPQYREKVGQSIAIAAQRNSKKTSARLKKCWQDPEFRKARIAAIHGNR